MAYFDPFSYFNLLEWYTRMPYVFDGIIYLLIFLGISMWVFSREKGAFGKRQGKTVAIGVGVALTFAMLIWEVQSGWRLVETGLPAIAVFVFGAIIFVFLYRMLEGFGVTRGCSAALAYLLVYPSIMFVFDNTYQYAYNQVATLGDILNIMWAVALIMFFWCVWLLLKSMGMGGKGGNDPDPGPIDMTSEPREKPKKERKPMKGKLMVNITHPPMEQRDRLPHGTTVELRGIVRGGSGQYQWDVLGDFGKRFYERKQRLNSGNGPEITADIPGLPPGYFKLFVVARDGYTDAKEEINIRILEPEKTGTSPTKLVNQFVNELGLLQGARQHWEEAGTQAEAAHTAWAAGGTHDDYVKAQQRFIDAGYALANHVKRLDATSRALGNGESTTFMHRDDAERLGTGYDTFFKEAGGIADYWHGWQTRIMNAGLMHGDDVFKLENLHEKMMLDRYTNKIVLDAKKIVEAIKDGTAQGAYTSAIQHSLNKAGTIEWKFLLKEHVKSGTIIGTAVYDENGRPAPEDTRFFLEDKRGHGVDSSAVQTKHADNKLSFIIPGVPIGEKVRVRGVLADGTRSLDGELIKCTAKNPRPDPVTVIFPGHGTTDGDTPPTDGATTPDDGEAPADGGAGSGEGGTPETSEPREEGSVDEPTTPETSEHGAAPEDGDGAEPTTPEGETTEERETEESREDDKEEEPLENTWLDVMPAEVSRDQLEHTRTNNKNIYSARIANRLREHNRVDFQIIREGPRIKGNYRIRALFQVYEQPVHGGKETVRVLTNKEVKQLRFKMIGQISKGGDQTDDLKQRYKLRKQGWTAVVENGKMIRQTSDTRNVSFFTDVPDNKSIFELLYELQENERQKNMKKHKASEMPTVINAFTIQLIAYLEHKKNIVNINGREVAGTAQLEIINTNAEHDRETLLNTYLADRQRYGETSTPP